ncbi:hypothetical protein GR130_19365 [Streptomyces sp. GS7]|nr:hypothetical protein GR130_19365 [Streptomyces sp. GS7]
MAANSYSGQNRPPALDGPPGGASCRTHVPQPGFGGRVLRLADLIDLAHHLGAGLD